MIVEKLFGRRRGSIEDVEVQASGIDTAQAAFDDIGHLGYGGGVASEDRFRRTCLAPVNGQEGDNSVTIGGLFHYLVLFGQGGFTALFRQGYSAPAARAGIDVEADHNAHSIHGIDKLSRQIERAVGCTARLSGIAFEDEMGA